MKKEYDFSGGQRGMFHITDDPFQGLNYSRERFAKVKIAYQINKDIKERNLKGKEAITLFGITEQNFSKLSKGKLSNFTLACLQNFLQLLLKSK